MATKKKTTVSKTDTVVNSIDKDYLKNEIVRQLRSTLGTSEKKASKQAWWKATCAAVNEQVFEKLTQTQQTHFNNDTRAVHYLSAEFLMGRLTVNNLINLRIYDICEEAIAEIGKDLNIDLNLSDLCEEEPDMALGNGGLGRLAACFIDSLATKNLPAVGYGIHYEHGLFRQEIRGGRQIERPDSWREYGNPWEICRPESVQDVPLAGYVETVFDEEGNMKKVWHPAQVIKGVPWDIPVVGYTGTVNILRLWESRASEFFDWDVFNAGGYVDSVSEKAQAEVISKVLYPNDSTEAGKILRLVQQYFFSSCSLKDILRRYKRAHNKDFSKFAEKIAVQLNDTHPTIAIPELMRLLVDEEELDWEQAWDICYKVFSYTNHTLLPEALEKWPLYLFERVLPRHLEIIYEINRRFLEDVVDKKWPGNDWIKSKLSIIEEGDMRKVRMANLCVIGSHKVNGVAEIHSKLVKEDLFPEFAEIWPDKFCNVTNGVTPRRWLLGCNRELAKLYIDKLGDNWVLELDELRKATKFADDEEFQNKFMEIKRQNKVKLAKVINELTGVEVSADAIFDVQVKRLHEYKRQQLNLLYIMALYRRVLNNPDYDMVPHVFIFGSKSAPGYRMAKDIIYAINKVAEKINSDPRVNGKIKVVFLPNYRVSLAEKIIPAADVSQQISTAGYEASGTSNMKFSMNGAITLGTLDGANIEIAEEAGAENNAIFGLTVDEVKKLKADGYNPWDYYYGNEELKAVLDWFDGDYFTPGKPGELSSVKNALLHGGDTYLALADFASYSEAHKRIDSLYRDKKKWARAAIINSTTMGKFNSDRSIQDYVDRIWALKSVEVK